MSIQPANRGRRLAAGAAVAGTALILIAVCSCVSVGPGAAIGPEKKIIKCGQDMPDARYLREHIRKLEECPFDGVVIDLTAQIEGKRERLWLRWFGPKPVEEQWLSESMVDLQATEFRRFTDNFVWVSTQSGHAPAPGWWDDEAWATITANMRLAAKFARDTGLKGIMLDVEQYGVRAWSHYMMRFDFSDPHVQEGGMVKRGELERRHTYEEFAAAARPRGKQIMRAMCDVYPGITILVIPGLHRVAKERIGAGRRKCPNEDLQGLASSDYGVLAPFGDGMLEGAGPDAVIIDGYESSYPFTLNERFRTGREEIVAACDVSAVPDLYRENVRVGYGLMLDYEYLLYGWNQEPSEFGRNHFTPRDFGNALHFAMLNSDRYVWIWNEWRGAVFWEDPQDKPEAKATVPAAYIDAIRHARQPRPLDSGRDQAAARAMPVPAPAATEAGHDPEARLAPLQAEYEFVADLPAEWLFFADEEALGFRLGYVEEDTDVSAWESIPISDCFQRFGHRFRGVAWYRTTFHVPKELEGRQVFLIFARVSVVHTWVNGRWANATVKHGCLVVNPNKRPSHRIRYGEENFVVVPVLTDGSPGGITGPVKLAVKKAQAGD